MGPVGREFSRVGPLTFIVRVSPADTGRLTGIVERVRTGERQRFRGPANLGQIVQRLAQGEQRRRRRVEWGARESEPGP